MVSNFHQNFHFGELISISLKIKNNILKTTPGLTFATKKIFSKNVTLLVQSITKKTVITIS